MNEKLPALTAEEQAAIANARDYARRLVLPGPSATLRRRFPGIAERLAKDAQAILSTCDACERLAQEQARLQGKWDEAGERCPQCGTGLKAHPLVVQAEARAARLQAALGEAFVILEGLRLAVVWELAPSIKADIAALVPKIAAALAEGPQDT